MKPVLVDLILKALAEGPMTRAEIADHYGIPGKAFGELLGRMSRNYDRAPQRIYISAWVMDHPGARRCPRPQYSLGIEKNKPKPKAMTVAQRTQRTYAKRVGTVASVWELGIPCRARLYLSAKRASQREALDAVSTVRRVIG